MPHARRTKRTGRGPASAEHLDKGLIPYLGIGNESWDCCGNMDGLSLHNDTVVRFAPKSVTVLAVRP